MSGELQFQGTIHTLHLATETRDESYKAMVGKLGDKQKAVFEILQRGDRTNSEIANALGWQINRVTPRVKELRDLNVVFTADKVLDTTTNRMVQRWTTKKNGKPDHAINELCPQGERKMKTPPTCKERV